MPNGLLAPRALTTAGRRDVDTTVVCAGGAVLGDPQTGAVLYHRPMHITLTETVTEAFDRHALDAFWFLHDEIHGEHGGADPLRYVETWSPRGTLADARRWSVAGEKLVLITIGPSPTNTRRRGGW